MSVETILSVALGLTFMYLLLSLIATAVSEMIAGAFCWRAATLQDGIRRLLNDPDGQALYKEFMSHPLMRSTQCVSGKKGPSYLSAQTFATALLDKAAPGLPAKAEEAFEHLRNGIESIKDPMIKGALESLAKEAQGDIDKLKKNVAAWFDDAMDRLSGTYKRKIQSVLVMLGVAVSVSVNADTLMVAEELWRNAALRAAISVQASQVAQGNGDAGYAEAKHQLEVFPIGWSKQPLPSGCWAWLSKVFGLLVTALAVSLGAPFWFDMLRRVNAIRSAGPKPPRGVDGEPSK